MNIVIFSDGIPPEGKGGAERIAWQSAQMLAEAGNTVTVITTTRSSGQTVVSDRKGIRIFTIPTSYHARWRAWRCLYNPGPVREVRRLLAELKPDIVHAHNVHQYLSYASLNVARASGARVLHTFHDAMSFNYDKLTDFFDVKNPICDPHPNYKISAWKQCIEQRFRYNPFRNVYIRYTLGKVDGLVAVSEALATALTQNGIKSVQVLYNGINGSKWSTSPENLEDIRRKYSLESKKVILFGGRITGTKGGDALLDALPEIIKSVPQAVLLIIGTENKYVRTLIANANAQGISTHIKITGWLSGDELLSVYHLADIVAVPSVYLDPLPTVVLEAMASRKPVVGSCLGGIPEMVEDSVTGYVLHPLATHELAEACIKILVNKEISNEFGNAGAKRQQEVFSEEVHLRNLLSLYSTKDVQNKNVI